MARLVPSWALQGLPGAAKTAASGVSRFSAQQSACSRPPPRRPGLSLLLIERVRERLGGPLRGVHHVVHDGLRFLHIVIAGVVDVLVDRSLLRLRAAAGVFAAQYAIVVAFFDPALQLGGAHRVERMRATQHAEDLEDAVERAACFLVLLCLR